MKLFLKMTVLLLVLAAAGPFFIKGQDGRPLMTISDLTAPSELVAPDLTRVKGMLEDMEQQAAPPRASVTSRPTQVYKWQDESGVWHFSDEGNTTGEMEVVVVDPNINLIHLDPVAVPSDPPAGGETDGGEKGGQGTQPGLSELPGPLTIPMAQVPQLLEQAKQLDNSLETRYQEQQQVLE